MHSEDSSKHLQKYVDYIMEVFDDLVNTTTQKTELSKRLYDIVTNQFGTSYVKGLFFSYSTAFDRNQLLFDLQLLRSYYFSDRLFRCPSNLSSRPVVEIFNPPVNTKRNLGRRSLRTMIQETKLHIQTSNFKLDLIKIKNSFLVQCLDSYLAFVFQNLF